MAALSWRQTTLSALVAAGSGVQTGPFGSELRAAEYVDRGVPVIMPRDLVDSRVSTAAIARVSARKARELARYELAAGDVVLARRGEIGRCALIGESEAGWLCGTGCLRVRPNGDLDSDFFFHLLRWPVTVDKLVRSAVGQTMLSLNTRILARLPLRVPDLEEQRRIASVLGSVDQAIDATGKVIAQGSRLRRSVLEELLTRGIAHRRWRILAGREIPASWRVGRLGELCSLRNGHSFRAADRAERGLPIVRIQNLNGSREFIRFGGRPKPEWIVEPGELLYAWAGVRGISFGPCLWPGPRGVLNQHIFRVAPRPGVDKGWLFQTLELATRAIERRAQGFKASLQHIRKADVTEQTVPVPPLAEQRAIAERAAALAAVEETERQTLDGLRKLRLGLMQDLFTGRTRVGGRPAGRP